MLTKNPSDEDCELSEWSVWTICTVDCGVGGEQQRFREVVRYPSVAGRQCRHLAEERLGCNEHIMCPNKRGVCVVSDWSQWADCSVDCGEGIQVRSRSITERTEDTPCPILKDEKYCLRQSCAVIDEHKKCKMSNWSPWSFCDELCGVGIQSRTRDVVEGFTENCPNKEETRPCHNAPCQNETLTGLKQILCDFVFN